MKQMKKTWALLLMLALVLALAGCGGGSGAQSADSQTAGGETEEAAEGENASEVSDVVEDLGDFGDAESDLQYVKDKGTLVIGITEFEPMDYQDTDGMWIGFDADLSRSFAASLGVEPVFQLLVDWDNKIFELNGKTVDVIWNGMTLTDEVLSSMECSNPYFNNAQVVIVRADAAENYQTVESLQDLSFAVEAGSAGAQQAAAYGFHYMEVTDQANALLEVSSGTADAAIIDFLMAKAMTGEGTSYADLTDTVSLNSEEYGVGFRKGSDLAAALNDYFAEAYASGAMQVIADRYGIEDMLIAQ